MSQPADTDTSNPADVLRELAKIKRETVESRGLDPRVALLREWQSQRLARTYADLMASKAYRPAAEFFLQDIYAARDFTQRNHDMEQVYGLFRRILPEPMVRPLAKTVEVHHLTEELDAKMLEVLIEELGVVDAITVDQYAEAYRRLDNYPERVRQIDLVREVLEMVDAAARMPGAGAAITIGKFPASRAGWGEIFGLVERGYKAYSKMGGHGREFARVVTERERQILDRIYARDPDPFRLEGATRPQ